MQGESATNTLAKLCPDLVSSGGGNDVEIQGEVRKAAGHVAGPCRVGLRRAGLQAQASDFRMAPRCVAASLVTTAQVGGMRCA